VSADPVRDDLQSLRAIEASLSTEAPFPITFDGLIHRWDGFVKEVESGYLDTVDDYTNDLSTRDLLDQITKAVPHELGAKLTARLQPIDQRLQRSTRHDPDDRLGKFFNHGAGWWWSRLPLKLDGDLAATLNA
jgi:hypothetical protein